jgi:hypothetical protein
MDTSGTHGDSNSLLEDFITKYYKNVVNEGLNIFLMSPSEYMYLCVDSGVVDNKVCTWMVDDWI